jgi:hypothetical protein
MGNKEKKMDYIKHIRSLVCQEKVIMVVAGAFVFDKVNRRYYNSGLIIRDGVF